MMEEPELLRPPVLSPCNSGRGRSNNNSNSPEFEFWMVRNPSFPQPNLLSADELFSDGVLLPLHLLQLHSSDDPPDQNAQEKPADPETSGSEHHQPGSRPDVSSVLAGVSAPTFTSSKRWKDIFKISGDRRSSKSNGSGNDGNNSKEKDKEKKKEKKVSGGGGGNGHGMSAAELNINIWPFSRSRSAGNGGSRPKVGAGATRKVSSAPCSRSNSASESKSRKWPSSPSRGGVHLGRSSPVWQVRHRSAAGVGATKTGAGDLVGKNAEKGVKREVNEVRRKASPATASTGVASTAGGGNGAVSGPKAKVLTLNVPMCIGYRHHLSCRSDENGAVNVVPEDAGAAGGDGGSCVVHGGGGGSDEGVVRGSNLFNIRSLFTKKVH